MAFSEYDSNYLECDLRCKYELVFFEQSSGSVHEHHVGNTINEI